MAHDDLITVVDWLADPAVAAWWGPAPDLAAVTAKYGPRLDSTGDPTTMWVVEFDSLAAGIVQDYRHADHPDHDAAVDIADAIGIDDLLGADHRGRGLAGSVLRRFAFDALERS